jgi:hypothetical protein
MKRFALAAATAVMTIALAAFTGVVVAGAHGPKKPKPTPPSKPAKPHAKVKPHSSEQTVTFCDMDTATTGKLETKPASEVARHEFNGKPEENRDIVPPFSFGGQTFTENFDANGQAIFAANCNQTQLAPKPTKPKHGVLGAVGRIHRTSTAGTLPFTGLRLWIVGLIGLSLIGLGGMTRLFARRTPS